MLQIQPCPERVEGRAERTNAVVDKLTHWGGASRLRAT
jgi:hypothetical protein